MEHRILTFKETKLIGKKITMSFAQNKTAELWQSFMPRKKEITNFINSNLYSVEIYPDTSFFKNFNPTQKFEKWAAIEVSDFNTVPKNMEKMVITQGLYAVFHYRGKPSEAHETFQYIYGV